MDISNKLSVLTGIPEASLNKFKKYLNSVHSDDMYTSMLENNDVHEIETFEGTILVSIDGNDLVYKFIPNDEFKKAIRNTVINDRSDLTYKLGVKVVNALTALYKEML